MKTVPLAMAFSEALPYFIHIPLTTKLVFHHLSMMQEE